MMRKSFRFCQYRIEWNSFSAVLADFGAAARTCSRGAIRSSTDNSTLLTVRGANVPASVVRKHHYAGIAD